MSSTPLPENVIRSLGRFLFACIPPGQAVVQLFDPDHGDLYLVKGSDDSEPHCTPGSPDDMLSELGLRSPPQALLAELVNSLKFAMQNDHGHSMAIPDRPASPSPLTVGISTLTDLSEMSFADPGTLDTSGALSDLRGGALFYGVESEVQGAFSPLPPVSPTPHRSGSTLRLHGSSHPSDGDASNSSAEGTVGSVYSQPDDGGEEPYVTCASIQPSFNSEGSAILGERSSSSPLKLFGLSSLPTGLSPSSQGTPFFRTGDGLSGLSASRVTADFSNFSPSPRSPSALKAPFTGASPSVRPDEFRAAYSPTTSTPVRDAMRRALAVMIMHRNSPQARSPRGRSSVRREVPATSPLSRSELVSLPAGEAAARIVAAVKSREQERTRAWAATQASTARHLDVGASMGPSASKSRV
ncbi:hypothetical protein LXA43DRAFT_943998 [Ganoderma leucocontextum]|nr:hypothetical protein LXA43DRAFT_943998 [Ganoderma leucocontextum]